MRSFQQVVFFLVALVAFAFAQDPTPSYESTVYVTSTIYKVNTVTLPSSPAYSVANSTTTLPVPASETAPAYTMPANSTAPFPTGSGTTSGSAPTEFPGAAAGLSVNGALLAALAAGLGYLAL